MFFKPFEMPVPPTFRNVDYDIRDFGAKEGISEKSTQAIKDAIEKCSADGGGRVVFPKGEWLTGAIHLKDNVNLHFCEGCYLHFSKDFNDYLPVVFGILGGNRCYSPSHFLYAYRCKNIAITGKGTLDGHGEAWWYMKHAQPGMEDLTRKGRMLAPMSERVYDKPEDGVRPRMVQFVECENVLIEDVTLKNSPSWTVHPAWCKNIIVRNISIFNPEDSPNTDGVNYDSCKRGLIEGIYVETGDDMCCLKAGKDQDAWDVGVPCEDIVVRNCKAAFKGKGSGGITIGSETSACIKNAYIHDCELGNNYYAIRIKTMKGRGGYVENLDFENITIKHARNKAISVTMRYTGEPLDDQSKPIENMPEVRNISIKNLRCESGVGSMELCGERGYALKNIYLSDIDITAETQATIENVSGVHMDNVTINFGRIPEEYK